ncbi:hypothetical protein PROFUN_11025 [Planoprotostelium fungivorum]|uniref:Arrestin C-terminal-like domain-containing protein n=1 Tax=Planoprotostelium fungivorum TaxID=1890364 RepID=A0A2P6NBQ9_9EUKA|nr:hypothetical protein PROFUN_11025 [Planoprotostelium fungivorum]
MLSRKTTELPDQCNSDPRRMILQFDRFRPDSNFSRGHICEVNNMHDTHNDQIQLTTDKARYYPGDHVAGTLTIHNDCPIQCKDVIVTLRNLVWVCSGGTNDRLEEEATYCESISFKEAGFLPNQELPPGVNEFAFLFPPVGGDGTIGTCHFPSCGSRWVMDATVRTPALRLQLTQQTLIHVTSISNAPSPKELYCQHRTSSMTSSLFHVPVSARMDLERTSYRPGDKIKVNITVENASERDLRAARLSLSRKLTGKQHLHDLNPELTRIEIPDGIQRLTTFNYSTNLEIPDHVLRSCRNDRLNVSYYVTLEVPKPGFHRSLYLKLEVKVE